MIVSISQILQLKFEVSGLKFSFVISKRFSSKSNGRHAMIQDLHFLYASVILALNEYRIKVS